VADAIYSGTLTFSQLFPDMTITVFIAELEKWFCGKFNFDSTTKIAWFEFFENNELYTPNNLTAYLAGKLKPQQAEQVQIVLNVNGSQDKTNDKEGEFIVFTHPAQKEVIAEFAYTGELTGGYMDFTFNLLAIEGIIHKNSAIQIDGILTAEETASPTTLQIGFYTGSYISASPNNAVYITSYTMFGNSLTVEAVLQILYEAYIDFRKNSNLPFEVKVKIPKPILEKLPLHVPVLINDQKVLIEKITSVEGTDDNTQTAIIRTLRNYRDRS